MKCYKKTSYPSITETFFVQIRCDVNGRLLLARCYFVEQVRALFNGGIYEMVCLCKSHYFCAGVSKEDPLFCYFSRLIAMIVLEMCSVGSTGNFKTVPST